jgi:hypothetical protein
MGGRQLAFPISDTLRHPILKDCRVPFWPPLIWWRRATLIGNINWLQALCRDFAFLPNGQTPPLLPVVIYSIN